MTESKLNQPTKMNRRNFGITMGAATGGMLASNSKAFAQPNPQSQKKEPAFIMGAFPYPPTAKLDEVGYYSWPGSSFEAEERQKQYMRSLNRMEKELNLKISMEETPLDTSDQVTRFIQQVQQEKPDGLLLIPFKKSHFDHVETIIEEIDLPTVILATQGILLNRHIQSTYKKSGVFLINSLDNLEAVQEGLNMIRTAKWMKQACIANITGDNFRESTVSHLGTTIKQIPHQRFYEEYANTKMSDEIKQLAKFYLSHALRIEEPNEEDIYEAAKAYYVLKAIVEEAGADAVMMNCLPGLKRPHKHVPPCMGFMNLRDDGIPAGCESDLDATLSMMLIQQLFNRPAFQHNPSMDTIKNHYFGAHCTSASKMHGADGPQEPFILRSHAEAGWGCVPRVLFSTGQEITFMKYLSRQSPPQMLVYSGTIVGCPANPPCGGCRTNMEVEVDELDDVCQVKGHHLCMFYGKETNQLRSFCQLLGIDAVS